MQDRPSRLEILAVARETLLTSMLPELEGTQRLDALMIANALSMVIRSLERGDSPLDAEHRRLGRLLGESERTDRRPETASLEDRLRELNRRFAREIRRGAFDEPGSARDAALRHVRETVIDKLRESNPKHLQREGFE